MFYMVRIPFWLAMLPIPSQRQKAIGMTNAYLGGSRTIISGNINAK